MIDLGRLNQYEPIDLTNICNTNIIMLNPARREYGIQITDEVSRINTENLKLTKWIDDIKLK